MFANRDEIVNYANDLVKLHDYPDYGPMGMQFGGSPVITGIASAVSVNTDIIQDAHDQGLNLLLVHHGLFWNNESRVLDEMHHGQRLNLLEEFGITLLAYHLALDAHPKFGNNILLARQLGLGKLTPWQEIGWSGELRDPNINFGFYNRAHKKLKLKDDEGLFFNFGPIDIHRVAVIAGGAAHYIIQAKKDGFDTFVTGEPSEPSYHLAHDLGMNFFALGHDRTERAGVQKLARLLSKQFHIPHKFIPSANPV